MQKELDGFCIEKEERNETEGKDAKMIIKTADWPKLPYVNAVTNVGDRKADIRDLSRSRAQPFSDHFSPSPSYKLEGSAADVQPLPLNLPHRTLADMQILTGRGANFRLGRGTIIVPQISCVLFDEQVFPNSRRFFPERFLNQKGQLERFE
ncbi:hypothetical protein niasHT_037880 [Heterodera trifolii]|uniref:Uncharacterized protein n=1 Tax=Heterodera trifolii TaxID=157864 RepID=A0ABD2IPM4_9BILA